MSRRTYSQRTCPACGERVSAAGGAQAAHKRKHVKDGSLVALYSPVLEKTMHFTPEEAEARIVKDTRCEWEKVGS